LPARQTKNQIAMNKINSVSEYVERIVEKTISTTEPTDTEIFWFRGEGSTKFKTPLVPNIYRNIIESSGKAGNPNYTSNKIRTIERNISSEFKRRSQRFISLKGIDNTLWNRYFLMQHYGINTRLLDWTENALLALFFAIHDNSFEKDDSIVWILNPFKLNDYTIKEIGNTPPIINNSYKIIPQGISNDTKTELFSQVGLLRLKELTRRYLIMDFNELDQEENDKDCYYPLAINPTFLDERMTSQKTCFTIFGNQLNGLKLIENKKEILDSIIINKTKKKRILKELKILGIDHESIYPDLDGIGRSIQKDFETSLKDPGESVIYFLKTLPDTTNDK
jgi:hypothetical protein